MSISKIAEAVGQLDDELVEAAEEYVPEGHSAEEFVEKTGPESPGLPEKRSGGERNAAHRRVLRVLLLAAALSLALAAGLLLHRILRDKPETSAEESDKYRLSVVSAETVMEWPWEYRTLFEKFPAISFGERNYLMRGREISPEYLGNRLGTVSLEQTAEGEEEVRSESFEVWEIRNISPEYLLAAGKDGIYEVYRMESLADGTEGYEMLPENLGDFLDSYGLAETLKLDCFSENSGYEEKGWYRLEDDVFLRQQLSECRGAKLLPEDSFDRAERENLSFTVTSEPLGVYKKVLIISEEGYLHTNILEYGTTYEIGKEAAGKMLEYARTHAEKAAFEPYQNTAAGIIREINAEYVLVDDTELCKKPEDGTVYKVPLTDIRIRRAVEYAGLTAGDLVVVTYEGDVSPDHEISGAVSLEQGFLTGEGVLIPE